MKNNKFVIHDNFDYKSIESKEKLNTLLNLRYKKNDLTSSSDKILEICEYIYNVLKLIESLSYQLNNYYRLSPLINYQIEDSKLLSIKIDRINNLCILTFKNVLAYNDARINKNIDVDVVNICMKLSNVQTLCLEGNISFDCIDSNKIIEHYLSKEDNTFCFSLLCLDGSDHLLLDIYFSEITIESFL